MGNGNAVCTHEEEGYCCFRKWDQLYQITMCDILSDAKFPDGLCHFRKLDPEGDNLYDCMMHGVDPSITCHIKMVDGHVFSNWE